MQTQTTDTIEDVTIEEIEEELRLEEYAHADDWQGDER